MLAPSPYTVVFILQDFVAKSRSTTKDPATRKLNEGIILYTRVKVPLFSFLTWCRDRLTGVHQAVSTFGADHQGSADEADEDTEPMEDDEEEEEPEDEDEEAEEELPKAGTSDAVDSGETEKNKGASENLTDYVETQKKRIQMLQKITSELEKSGKDFGPPKKKQKQPVVKGKNIVKKIINID